MKFYLVEYNIAYEGGEVVGIFKNKEDAKRCVEEMNKLYEQYTPDFKHTVEEMILYESYEKWKEVAE